MKEILVLCPFGVDKGLLSKAARLSGGELRALVPAGEAETAAEYGACRIFELSAPEIGDESAFAAFLSETIRRWTVRSCWLRQRCGCATSCPCLRGSWTRD